MYQFKRINNFIKLTTIIPKSDISLIYINTLQHRTYKPPVLKLIVRGLKTIQPFWMGKLFLFLWSTGQVIVFDYCLNVTHNLYDCTWYQHISAPTLNGLHFCNKPYSFLPTPLYRLVRLKPAGLVNELQSKNKYDCNMLLKVFFFI